MLFGGLSVLEKKKGVLSFPSVLTLEITNFCNLHCPLCPTGSKSLTRRKEMMSFENFKRIIDQCVGKTKLVILYNFGEPFLHKDVFRMIKYIKMHGLKVQISTNASFSTSVDWGDKVVHSGLDTIIFSLDGLDQKTLEQYRVGVSFEKVLLSLRKLIKAKKRLHSSHPEIIAQFLIMRHNEHQRLAMKDFMKKEGVDYFVEKSISVPFRTFSEFKVLSKQFLPQNILFNYYASFPEYFSLHDTLKNDCPHIKKTMYINADGSVIACCHDNGEVNDSSHPFYLGNAFKDSLRNIWLGKKAHNFRKQLFHNQSSFSLCLRCPFSRESSAKNTSVSFSH